MSYSPMNNLTNVIVIHQVDETIIILNHQHRLGRKGMIRSWNRPCNIGSHINRKRLERHGVQ